MDKKPLFFSEYLHIKVFIWSIFNNITIAYCRLISSVV